MILDMRLRLAVISGVLVLFLPAVPSAVAAPAWLAPARISEEGREAARPQVAFDARGDAVVVWESRELYGNRVEAAFRPAGGSWQAPELLGWCGEAGCEPDVAMDAQGDAVVVWNAYSALAFNGRFRVQAAFRSAGGAWQSPVYVAPEEVPGTSHPRVAFDAHGDAMAIWNRQGPWGGVVQEAFRPAGGAWQAPVDITARGEQGDEPQVAFDKRGDALAVWQADPVSEWVLESAFMPAGGSWQAPVVMSAPGFARGPSVAFNGQGEATAVWAQWTHGVRSTRTVQAASWPAGGPWQAPVNIVGKADEMDQPKEAGEPSVAMDGQGDAIAIWAWEFGGPVIQTAFKPGGGAWQEPVDLSTFGEDATNPEIAFDNQGDAIAVWNVKSATGAPEIVQSAYKPAGSVWQAPTDLSGADNSGYEPLVAFDGEGDAVAAWAGENGSIQSAGYVAAGPQLNDVSIPTSGVVGQPVTFSVSPFDVWSIAGGTGWSFGDGASASGASVTHIYAAPGTYEVTIQSADTLGNVTSTAGKITIAPAVTSAPSPSEPLSGPPTSEPPAIGVVDESASVWRERGKSRVGTTFSLSLNEQASVSLSFMRHVNGRMVGRRCLAKTPKNAGHRVCSRTVITGVLSFAGHSGMNMFSFRGLVSHSRKLLPGRYTVVITATNVAGRRSSPNSLSFTIVE